MTVTVKHLLALSMALCLMTQAWAGVISPEKLKRYAELYPDMFIVGNQTVGYRPAGKPQAVSLLLQSYNGNTNVEELSAVLKPGDVTGAMSASLKPEAQLKTMLSAKGLTWQEYQAITQSLAKSESSEFQAFFEQVNKSRMRAILEALQAGSPVGLKKLGPEHQAIVAKCSEKL